MCSATSDGIILTILRHSVLDRGRNRITRVRSWNVFSSSTRYGRDRRDHPDPPRKEEPPLEFAAGGRELAGLVFTTQCRGHRPIGFPRPHRLRQGDRRGDRLALGQSVSDGGGGHQPRLRRPEATVHALARAVLVGDRHRTGHLLVGRIRRACPRDVKGEELQPRQRGPDLLLRCAGAVGALRPTRRDAGRGA
jgi:hypothetical protein